MTAKDFDLDLFLPYLLNQAAETTSFGFHAVYRDRYGMTRTQWRVLANLGKFGAMTARDICAISHIEKTKVSRAVAAPPIVLAVHGVLPGAPRQQPRGGAQRLNHTIPTAGCVGRPGRAAGCGRGDDPPRRRRPSIRHPV